MRDEKNSNEIIWEITAIVLAVVVASVVFVGVLSLLPYIAMGAGIAVGIHFTKEHYKKESLKYLKETSEQRYIDNKMLGKEKSKETELGKQPSNKEWIQEELSSQNRLTRENNNRKTNDKSME